MNKKYWLLKSEPDVWSIDQQKKAGIKGAPWDGVRNYQAANNLRKMKKGDLCFFYHSNIGKEIVGIVEVIKTAFFNIFLNLTWTATNFFFLSVRSINAGLMISTIPTISLPILE